MTCQFMGKYLLLTYTWSPRHFCPLLCVRGTAASDSIWCHWLQRVPYGWLNQQLSLSAIWLLWLSWFQCTLFVLINLPPSSTFGGRKPLFSSELLPDSRDVFAVFLLLFSTHPVLFCRVAASWNRFNKITYRHTHTPYSFCFSLSSYI